MASEVGGTTPASECLGSETGVLECVREEENGIANLTYGCVPGVKELFSTLTSPCWEGDGGLLADSS